MLHNMTSKQFKEIGIDALTLLIHSWWFAQRAGKAEYISVIGQLPFLPEIFSGQQITSSSI